MSRDPLHDDVVYKSTTLILKPLKNNWKCNRLRSRTMSIGKLISFSNSEKSYIFPFCGWCQCPLYSRKSKTMESIANDELDDLFNLLASNKLTYNTKKTNLVIFHPQEKKLITISRLIFKMMNCQFLVIS